MRVRPFPQNPCASLREVALAWHGWARRGAVWLGAAGAAGEARSGWVWPGEARRGRGRRAQNIEPFLFCKVGSKESFASERSCGVQQRLLCCGHGIPDGVEWNSVNCSSETTTAPSASVADGCAATHWKRWPSASARRTEARRGAVGDGSPISLAAREIADLTQRGFRRKSATSATNLKEDATA